VLEHIAAQHDVGALIRQVVPTVRDVRNDRVGDVLDGQIHVTIPISRHGKEIDRALGESEAADLEDVARHVELI
jgi:hypothetical protein